ncbi:MAG: hypothetical protein ACR2N3_05575 [Pyrinomonadaceae bacterium]
MEIAFPLAKAAGYRTATEVNLAVAPSVFARRAAARLTLFQLFN